MTAEDFPKLRIDKYEDKGNTYYRLFVNEELVARRIILRRLGDAISTLGCDALRAEHSAKAALLNLCTMLCSALNMERMETVRVRRYIETLKEENEAQQLELDEALKRAEAAERRVRNLNLWIEIKGIESYKEDTDNEN